VDAIKIIIPDLTKDAPLELGGGVKVKYNEQWNNRIKNMCQDITVNLKRETMDKDPKLCISNGVEGNPDYRKGTLTPHPGSRWISVDKTKVVG
jgi:hypothetical protein